MPAGSQIHCAYQFRTFVNGSLMPSEELGSSSLEINRLLGRTGDTLDFPSHGRSGYSDAPEDTDIELNSRSGFPNRTTGSDADVLSDDFMKPFPDLADLYSSRLLNSTLSFLRPTIKWIIGPQPPRPFTVTPMLPNLQLVPLRLLDYYIPSRRRKILLFLLCFLTWTFGFSILLSVSSSKCTFPGYELPVRLSCISRFWFVAVNLHTF